jgi:glutamyl-Q tRNA(Asp) synthetase
VSYRGRFAPSPTGALHFGSLVAALASWLRARQAGGTWLVRIEDLDPPREVPGAALAQLYTLQAFGMESDEPPWWQSRRGEVYERELQRLRALDLAFECRCSRSDLAAQEGIHRFCVAAPATRPAAVRARVPDLEVGFVDAVQGPYAQNLAREVGDFVLRRVEGFAAYQLAVVVDDAAQGITEVVRGCDLLDSTPRQRWLQRVLGYREPDYLHVPLALDADGRKLSKAMAALPVDEADPLPALRAAWRFLGQERLSATSVAAFLREATVHFEPADIPAVPSRPV